MCKNLSLLFLSMLIIFHFALVCQCDFQHGESLLLQVFTDKKSYVVGEPILFSLSFVNPTDDVITLTFRTSKIFDGCIWIYSEDGEFFEKIYDASNCVFLPVITVVEIEPYGSKEILNLNYSSSFLKAGIYIIKAVSEDFSAETSIQVHAGTMPEFSVISIITFLVLFTFLIAKFRLFKRSLPSYYDSGLE